MAINEKKAYAAYYDNDIRMKSSSGAIFSLLANEVLEKKGIVYGVAMNASCTEAEYIGITEKQELEKLLGSKYLQAKIKNIFKSIGIILLLLCFNSVMFSIFNINLKSLSEKEYLIYTVLFELVLLIIFIIIYRKTLSKNGKEYFKNFSENFKQSFKYWLVGFIVMATSNIIITFVLKQTIAGNEELVRSYIDTSPLLMIFSTVIYAPICEELTFRKSIKDAINNKYIYILTSGLLFGFLHIVSYINTPLDLVYLIPYASLGIVFATLYYKTNNIFSTITIHAMHNALSVLVYLSLGGLS